MTTEPYARIETEHGVINIHDDESLQLAKELLKYATKTHNENEDED